MKLLILLSFFLSSAAYADQCCLKDKKSSTPCCKKEEKPKTITKIKWKTKWKTNTVEKRVPVYINPPAAKEKCCEKPKRIIQRARTGNQKVIIQMPKQKTKIIKVIKVRTKIKIKRKRIIVTKPNRLMILVGQSKTKQAVEQVNCCDIKATRKYEPDLGLQYVRDFGSLSGSLMGTTNNSFYVGIGANW